MSLHNTVDETAKCASWAFSPLTPQSFRTRCFYPGLQAEEMAAERHALESSVIEMNTHGAQIERWLRDNESKTPTGRRPRFLCCLRCRPMALHMRLGPALPT